MKRLFKLDNKSIEELTWWSQNLNPVNDICRLLPKMFIFSDACPNGWAAANNPHVVFQQKSNLFVN